MAFLHSSWGEKTHSFHAEATSGATMAVPTSSDVCRSDSAAAGPPPLFLESRVRGDAAAMRLRDPLLSFVFIKIEGGGR